MRVAGADEEDPGSSLVAGLLTSALRIPLGPVYRSQRKESRSVSSWIMYSYFSLPGA